MPQRPSASAGAISSKASIEWRSYAHSFAQRLRWLREFRQLSQEQLAIDAGLHRNLIGKLESAVGRTPEVPSNPTLYTVYCLAHALDVPPHALMPDLRVVPRRVSGEFTMDISWATVQIELEESVSREASPAVAVDS